MQRRKRKRERGERERERERKGERGRERGLREQFAPCSATAWEKIARLKQSRGWIGRKPRDRQTGCINVSEDQCNGA